MRGFTDRQLLAALISNARAIMRTNVSAARRLQLSKEGLSIVKNLESALPFVAVFADYNSFTDKKGLTLPYKEREERFNKFLITAEAALTKLPAEQ